MLKAQLGAPLLKEIKARVRGERLSKQRLLGGAPAHGALHLLLQPGQPLRLLVGLSSNPPTALPVGRRLWPLQPIPSLQQRLQFLLQRLITVEIGSQVLIADPAVQLRGALPQQ